MSTTAPMHKNKKTTLGRIKCFIAKGPLAKNAIQNNKISHGIPSFVNKLYSKSIQFSELEHWKLPGGNGSWQKFSFNEISKQQFAPVKLGDTFGPTWSTHWFLVKFNIPGDFKGEELHLRFNSGSEASLYNSKGEMLGAFSPDFRNEVILSECWPGDEPEQLFYIEMACNGMFGGGLTGENLDIGPPDLTVEYPLNQLDISVLNPTVFKLLIDLEMLYGMASELEDDHIGYQAMFTANEMINLIIDNKHQKASDIGDAFFSEKNGQKAHQLIAIGHCHIDTAWLWGYDETIRKCARSWKSQIELIKAYPDFIFVCSQAQQFKWIKKCYPALFEEIKEFVAKGNFVPVGGTYVEMDGLLPSGESFIRQFFYGQQFFKNEFGIKCQEFFLPDTFGYSGQIPQILKHVGIDRFLTQKLSWSIVNKFQHHNFIWEGIDGSQVLVHFPPGDSYTMTASVKQIIKSARNSQDKGRANVGAYLFGHGDGGGGPTKTMIEKLKRVQDVDGLPKVKFAGTNFLFEKLAEEKHKLCKWVGELYLELHNGTYTSQAKIKWYNRKLEQFLMEVDLLISIAYTSGSFKEEQLKIDLVRMDRCWRKLLLNQFHDVLPGSCIELVKDDAWQIYQSIFTDLISLRNVYNKHIFGSGGKDPVVFNPLAWNVKTVICTTSPVSQKNGTVQTVTLNTKPFANDEEGRKLPHKFYAILANLSASGYSKLIPSNPHFPSKLIHGLGNSFKFCNGKLRLHVETENRIPVEKLYLLNKDQEEVNVFVEKAGMLYIFDDVPLFWDAWDCMDYHLETKQQLKCSESSGPEIVAEGPLFTAYKWNATFGESSNLTRYTIMRADSPFLEYFLVVDWKESHKFLKVQFPVDVLSRDATYEIQFGHLKRPNHTNTSFEMAQFEVSSQKWMDISQADKGVTFITDSKFGWHVRDNIVQLSLLRSPKSPDGNCDMHKHFIHYAVLPHLGTFQEAGVIRKAYEFNFFNANDLPLWYPSDIGKCNLPDNCVTASNEAVVVETVKVASSLNKTLCIRLYESFGGSAKTKVKFGFTVKEVVQCNGLEEPLPNHTIKIEENSFESTFTPFQIQSFLVHF